MRLFPMALMFLFCMVSLGVPADALAGAGDADDATVADADARLARLTALLRTGKSTRIDLVAAIDAVAESYATVGEN